MEYALRYKQYYNRYPYAGFGQMFQDWAKDSALKKQKSYGNGGAMRVMPIAYAYKTLDEVLNQAKLCCIYTHNHKEAIYAAQATAAATFLAHNGSGKDEIKNHLKKNFGYEFSKSVDELRKDFVFDSRAGYSVPPAITAFLESDSYEDAVRKAVSLGGDSDTIACIAGGIAEAYYKTIPEQIKKRCFSLLDSGLKKTIQTFCDKFIL